MELIYIYWGGDLDRQVARGEVGFEPHHHSVHVIVSVDV